MIEAGIALDGAADHGVSEAVYLHDPDGNGIELYRDRPREEWPRDADGRTTYVEGSNVHIPSMVETRARVLAATKAANDLYRENKDFQAEYEKQNVKFATQMTTLASDLASFHNTDPEEAIQALGSALRGEAAEVSSSGAIASSTSRVW